MTNLTAVQYKTEYDNAYKMYKTFSATQTDRGAAWVQIASAYAHLQRNQEDFDDKGIMPSPAALVYRTAAEDALKLAKTNAGANALSPNKSGPSCLSSNAAGVAAFQYVHQVRRENKL